jgi:glutaredoxin
MAKEFFAKNNIEYEDIDVTTDQAAMEEMKNKSHQLGVPVIDIDGQIFVGFPRVEIAKVLKIKN